jgi:hypothetical protein
LAPVAESETGASGLVNGVNNFLIAPLLNNVLVPLLKGVVGADVAGSTYTLPSNMPPTCRNPKLAG